MGGKRLNLKPGDVIHNRWGQPSYYKFVRNLDEYPWVEVRCWCGQLELLRLDYIRNGKRTACINCIPRKVVTRETHLHLEPGKYIYNKRGEKSHYKFVGHLQDGYILAECDCGQIAQVRLNSIRNCGVKSCHKCSSLRTYQRLKEFQNAENRCTWSECSQ